jgi:hypothetical protein
MNTETDHRRIGTLKMAIGIAVATLGHFFFTGIGRGGVAGVAVFAGVLAAVEGARQAYAGAEPKSFDRATYRREHPALYYLTRSIQFITFAWIVIYLGWIVLRSAP